MNSYFLVTQKITYSITDFYYHLLDHPLLPCSSISSFLLLVPIDIRSLLLLLPTLLNDLQSCIRRFMGGHLKEIPSQNHRPSPMLFSANHLNFTGTAPRPLKRCWSPLLYSQSIDQLSSHSDPWSQSTWLRTPSWYSSVFAQIWFHYICYLFGSRSKAYDSGTFL